MIKGVIFDLDGVLVHTDELHYRAWKKIADENKWIFNKRINDKLRGVSRIESLNTILKYNNIVLSDNLKELLCVKKNEYYKKIIEKTNKSLLSLGAVDILKYLKSKNYKIALASSSKNAEIILEKENLKQYFDVIVTGNDITNSKPNPEIFIKSHKLLKLKATEVIVVEDAKSGIDAANRAGIISVGINKAYKYGESIYKISSLNSLINLLETFNVNKKCNRQ